MLHHETRFRCILCDVVLALCLTNIATDTANVRSKKNNRHKVVLTNIIQPQIQ